jgi:spore germination protein KC
MGKKYLRVLGMVVVILMLTGCNGAKETDQIGYVLLMGLDKGEGEKINVTYQVANPSAIGGQGEASKDTFTSFTFSVNSIGEARNLLNSTLAVDPVVYHVKAIVFGETLARKGIGDTLGPLMRFREYRGSTFMIVAKGTAQEFIKQTKPIFNLSPAKFIELMMESNDDSGFYPSSTLHNFYLRMKQNTSSPYAVFAATNVQQDLSANRPPNSPLPERKEQSHLPGKINRKGGSPSEFVGTALFKGDKMVGLLDSNETRALLILFGDFKTGFVAVEDPLSPTHTISLRLRAAERPKITTQVINNRPFIKIKQQVDGVVTSNGGGINYESEEYRGLLENRLTQVLTEDMNHLIKTSQAVNSDVIGLGLYMASNFQMMQQLENFHWLDRYGDADIEVVVEAKVRRSGLMWKTNPIVRSE